MAEHGAPEYATATGNDYVTHERTYEGFVHLTFIGLIHVINTLIGLAIGGVVGNWLVAIAIIFVIAPAAAVYGFMTGTKTSSLVALGLSLLSLALTA